MGTRSRLDVPDAEQELVLSHVSLVNSRRNRVVATYELIAPNLGLRRLITTRYPLSAHRGRFFGVTTDTVD